MNEDRDEEELLRAVTLENARSIFRARQRAEEELVRTKEALWQQSEWLRVTLASIGDAVVTTDIEGRVLVPQRRRGDPDRLDASGGAGASARRDIPDHQRGEPSAGGETLPRGPSRKAASSAWPTTRSSSPKTARKRPSTTARRPFVTTRAGFTASC